VGVTAHLKLKPCVPFFYIGLNIEYFRNKYFISINFFFLKDVTHYLHLGFYPHNVVLIQKLSCLSCLSFQETILLFPWIKAGDKYSVVYLGNLPKPFLKFTLSETNKHASSSSPSFSPEAYFPAMDSRFVKKR